MGGRHAHRGRQPPPPRQQPQSQSQTQSQSQQQITTLLHHRELHQLLTDQKEMISLHTSLKNLLSSLDEELRHLSVTARELKAQKEAQIGELYDNSIKLEAEVRAVEDLKVEVRNVVGDVRGLSERRGELVKVLDRVEVELRKVKSEGLNVGGLKEGFEDVVGEIRKARAAVELEKKARIANLEMSEAMEKKKSSMQNEIEMLRAELLNAEKRARAAAAAVSNPNPGYMGNYGSRSMAYGGSPYSVQYSMHQGQLTADVPPPALYGHPGGPLDIQQPHVPR